MSDDRQRSAADDQLRERVPGSRLKLWLLLDASRWVVAVGTLASTFLVLVVLGTVDPVGLRTAVGSSDPIETAFQALATAIVTGVTLVVTINQLVLSQELGAVGDQRERMEGALDFRREAGDVLGEVPPADPAEFLRSLAEAIRDRAGALAAAAEETGGPGTEIADADARRAVVEYAVDCRESADAVAGRLAGGEFGSFEVVSAALDFEYGRRIHQGRRLRADRGPHPSRVEQSFEDLLSALELYGPAREHVKTLYFQWELIDLSRAVVYAAVPALVTALSMVLYVDDPATITGTVLGVDALVVVVAAAATVALLPFALLLAYVLRIATVAKRTLAIGPFVLRGEEDS